METLKKQYEEEYRLKCKVEADLQALKDQLQISNNKQMEKIKENVVKIERKNDDACHSAQQEIMKRLQKLQSSMVGGERVHDRELREKRLRKKREAEKRLNRLAQVLTKVEDEEGPNLVLKVYDDIHDELRAKTDLLRKYKQKVKAMDQEITDLQSEFEIERTDYLETIRKQDRQLKLHNQIVEKLLPHLSRDFNLSDIEKMKNESKWSDELQCWEIPEITNTRIKLPPATGIESEWGSFSDRSINSSNSTSPISFNANRRYSLDQKLQEYDVDNFAGNYFRPRRATELLIQARENATKSSTKWKEAVQASMHNNIINNSDNHLVTSTLPLTTLDHYKDKEQRRTSQASPIAWMTGNVRISPNVLNKTSGKIGLLPLINEKKVSRNAADL